jgi:hypothetical protein
LGDRGETHARPGVDGGRMLRQLVFFLVWQTANAGTLLGNLFVVIHLVLFASAQALFWGGHYRIDYFLVAHSRYRKLRVAQRVRIQGWAETASGRAYPRRESSLGTLARFAELFPASTAKAIRALAGDYDDRIRGLRRDHRNWAARWSVGLAWGCAMWYVLRWPFDAAYDRVMKSFGRPG